MDTQSERCKKEEEREINIVQNLLSDNTLLKIGKPASLEFKELSSNVSV